MTAQVDESSTPVSAASGPERLAALRSGPVLLVSVVVVALVVAGLRTPHFFTWDNAQTILRAAAIVGIAAVGMSFVTITGNFISLATGGTAVLAAVVFGLLSQHGMPVVPTVLCTLAVAAVLGGVQGVFVGLGFNPIITTLGAGGILMGVASWMTNLHSVVIHDSAALSIGRSAVAGVPSATIVFVALAVIGTIFRLKHRYGRLMALVGTSKPAAEATGLRPARVAIVAFGLASLCAALASVLQTSQFGQANTQSFPSLTFDVIAAVLVGGIPVAGGRGTPAGAALGAVVIALISNIMLLHGYSFGTRTFVQGVLVAVAIAVSVSALRARRSS